MKCPKHPDTPMYQTTWRPPRGMDSRLRQYKCGVPGCDYIEYKRVS